MGDENKIFTNSSVAKVKYTWTLFSPFSLIFLNCTRDNSNKFKIKLKLQSKTTNITIINKKGIQLSKLHKYKNIVFLNIF